MPSSVASSVVTGPAADAAGDTVSGADAPAHGDRLLSLRLDARPARDGAAPLKCAVDLRIPNRISQPARLLVCLPGGGMNRRFFDLMSGDDDSYSFARAMTAQGYLVAMLDHPGIGDSDRPLDADTLTPDFIADANAQVTAQLLSGLRSGTLDSGVAALPTLQSIGVGHSMGAMLTVLQQAAHAQHRAIAVLGFSTRGLPEYVSAEVLALSRTEQRARLVELARLSFAKPATAAPAAPRSGDAANTGDFYAAGKAEPRGAAALRPALDRMLTLPAFLSMLPDNIAEACAQIRVPVFIGLGELDIAGPTHAVPASFAASTEVCLHILPQAGHSHFIFAARRGLFRRMAQWLRALAEE